MSIVVGLANMSAKQLGAVSHLLPPGTVEAIGIAAKLPRSNQVRCTRGPGGRGAGVLGSREPGARGRGQGAGLGLGMYEVLGL